jgi:AcrR family transcriptional regulator
VKQGPEDGRAARSRATRARIAAAAARLFVENGYASTSIATIANEAGVATQTVYNAFANKPAILSAALDLAIAGDDAPVATLERAWVRDALAAPDAVDQVRRQVDGAAEILARVSPLLEVIRGAAPTDPDLAAAWRANIEQRRTVQNVFVEALAGRGALRPGLTVDDATDVTLALLSPETYTLLTVERGWSPDRWRAWARDALLRQLTDLGN